MDKTTVGPIVPVATIERLADGVNPEGKPDGCLRLALTFGKPGTVGFQEKLLTVTPGGTVETDSTEPQPWFRSDGVHIDFYAADGTRLESAAKSKTYGAIGRIDKDGNDQRRLMSAARKNVPVRKSDGTSGTIGVASVETQIALNIGGALTAWVLAASQPAPSTGAGGTKTVPYAAIRDAAAAAARHAAQAQFDAFAAMTTNVTGKPLEQMTAFAAAMGTPTSAAMVDAAAAAAGDAAVEAKRAEIAARNAARPNEPAINPATMETVKAAS